MEGDQLLAKAPLHDDISAELRDLGESYRSIQAERDTLLDAYLTSRNQVEALVVPSWDR